MNVSDYCRDIETYLCRKNDGHLIRIVGPSFEVVSRWAASGVPLKVAHSGIDRYFERYYRKGPRRRPVKIDFCEADVLDVFDEWRRATGVSGSSSEPDSNEDRGATPKARRGVSLPEHLERALIRLSSLRATGALADSVDPLIDRLSAQLDLARSKGAGLRGDARRDVIEHLAQLDLELVDVAIAGAGLDVLDSVRRDAEEDLAPFRATMTPDAFAAALERARRTRLRERLGLPILAFS